MINIITGSINSGKTNRMLEIYEQTVLGRADGFVSLKTFKGNKFNGYEIVRLRTGQSEPLAILADEFNNQFNYSFPYGQYVFSQAAFYYGESIIKELLSDEKVSDIFIDEIGPIELEGRGFDHILREVIKVEKNVYICVNNNCLDEVIKRFNINKFKVI